MSDRLKRYTTAFLKGAGDEALNKIGDIGVNRIMGVGDDLVTSFAKDFIINPQKVRQEMFIKMNQGFKGYKQLTPFTPDTTAIYNKQTKVQGILDPPTEIRQGLRTPHTFMFGALPPPTLGIFTPPSLLGPVK